MTANMHHDDSRAIVAEAEATNREPLDPYVSPDCYPGTNADDFPDDPEPETHYHVTAHIPGCLNDTNDGPYLDIESARESAAELAVTYYGDDTFTVETGNRFEWFASPSEASYRDYGSGYLITVEECTEPACLEMDNEPF